MSVVEKNLNAFTEKNKTLNFVDKFLNGWVFLLLLAIFIFVVQMMGWDTVGFYVLATVFFVASVFCRNTRVTFSVVCMAIFCVSTKNSPNMHASGFKLLGKCEFEIGPASTFYSSQEFFTCVTVCAVMVGFAILYRLIFFSNLKNLLSSASIVGGLVCLAVAFGLGGIKSEGYNKTDLYFGLIQSATFLFIYLYFSLTQKKQYFTFDYIANLLITVFVFMLALLIYLYATRFKGFLNFDGRWKACLVPGWGWSLDIGTYLTLGIVALTYKIYKAQIVIGWFSLIVIGVVAIFFSLARGALLTAGIVLLVCFFGAMFKKGLWWKVLIYTFIAVGLVSCVITYLIVNDNSKYFLDYFLDRDWTNFDSGRFNIWKQYWAYFKDNKIFGVGFAVEVEGVTELENGVFGIYSSLAHNLIIQFAGSCGIVGLVAFGIHLIQTAIVCFEKKDKSKKFFALAIFAFLFMSALDTVFFKVQFIFVYLGLLLVCELSCQNTKEENTP